MLKNASYDDGNNTNKSIDSVLLCVVSEEFTELLVKLNIPNSSRLPLKSYRPRYQYQ